MSKINNNNIKTSLTKTITHGDSIVSKIITYEEAKILVIFDKNENAWYKGKDICIILEYADTKGALSRLVCKEYKKSYANMKAWFSNPLNIDPQTLFVDNTGLYQLISKSQKSGAIKLWRFITKQDDIDILNKSFYDDNMLSDYKNKLAIYLAYIGQYNGKHILKFGKSNDFVQRDLKQHRKMYKKFNVIKVWETLANDLVEEHLKINFASKKMLTALTKEELKITCREATKCELVLLYEINDLDYCISMIDNVVNNTILPQENKYQDEIRNLKHKYEILETKYNADQKYIKQLEENINDLRILLVDNSISK